MIKITTSHSKYKGIVVGKTDMRKLRAGLQGKASNIIKSLIVKLSMIGESCVKIAREKGSYGDVTGNLRSSIGYVILYDGNPVINGNPARYKGKHGDGAAGPPAAEALLARLRSKYPRGLVLIVCAGMSYAAYVEAVYHKDVLTSAELKMESLARKLLNGLTVSE